MAPEKAPAFQFYPKDFLSDSNVLRMSMEARGVYITLLALAWLDGTLPAETSALAGMVNMNAKQFERVWPAVRVCFDEAGGRLVQGRLEQEREKQAENRRRASDRGARGADTRWSKHAPSIEQASASNAQAMLSDSSSSSSSISSANCIQPSAVIPPPAPALRFVGKQKPVPGYRRLRVFPFMVDEILGMLGEHAVDFDLDKWLLQLDASGRVLPPNIWPWLKESVSADAASRGFGAATVMNGSHTNIDAVRDILRRDGVIE